MRLLLFNSLCVGRVQVSIYLSVSAFHLIFIKSEMGGLLLEYNGKVIIGLESSVGFPYGRVGNPTGDSLRNAFLLFSLYCIPFGLIYSQFGFAVGIQRRGGWLLP